MFHHVQVRINKSETTHVTIDVAPWELPVLAAVHGEDRVIPTGVTIPVRRPKPEPAAEFDRMSIKYKQNRETGVDYVASVYGNGALGVRRLAEEMVRGASEGTDELSDEDEGSSSESLGGELIDDNDSDPMAGLFDDPPASAARGAQPVDQ